MVKCAGVFVFVTFSFILGACCTAGAVEEQTGDWSEVHDYLKARLHLEHRFVMGSYSEILVYLELCNTCPPEGTLRVSFPFSSVGNLFFTVKDSEGNAVEPTRDMFGSTIYSPKPFTLTLPQDGTMRFCISQNGGGVSEDRVLLYLVPAQGWYFKHGEDKAYELTATLSIEQRERFEDQHWAGELKLPPVRIPVPEAGQTQHPEGEEKAKN